MMKKEKPWVIFDYYGVIAREGTLNAARSHHDPQIIERVQQLNDKKDLDRLSLEEYIERLAVTLGVSVEYARQLENPLDGYDTQLTRYIHLLHRRDIRLAVASNSYEQSLKRNIQEAGLEGVFDIVLCSSSIGVLKPQIGFWKALTERIGEDPNTCLFIDDRPANCQAAQQFGFQVWQYEGFAMFHDVCERFLIGEEHARTT